MAETDYLAQSSGHPTGYSAPFSYPFSTAEYQPVDPRTLRIHDAMTIMVEFDGVEITASYTIGPSDNVETALFTLAQMLDAVDPGFHTFSRRNTIAIQAAPGHAARLRSITMSPYRVLPHTWIVVPFEPPLGATKALLDVRRNGALQTFVSGPTVEAMAAKLNKSPWLSGEPVTAGLKVSAIAGFTLVVEEPSFE